MELKANTMLVTYRSKLEGVRRSKKELYGVKGQYHACSLQEL